MSSEESTPPQLSSTQNRRKVLLKKLNPTNMPLRYQLGLLGLLGFFLLPTQLYPSQMGPFVNLLFLMMFAMSWDVVSGYTGQLSFGHAFFFALGGYSSAILNMQHGISPLVSIPAGMVVAAIGGIIVGLPALRLRGPYLSLVTLIVPIILAKLFILFNDSLVVLGIAIAPQGLGGQTGLSGIPQPLVSSTSDAVLPTVEGNLLFSIGKPILDPEPFQIAVVFEYYMSLLLFLVILAVLLAVTRSSAGSVFTAIREDEDAVAAAGKNPAKFKLFAFVLSGTVGGLAGATYVHTSVAIAQPAALLGSSNIHMSINVIIMAILGGIGTVVGAAVGGVLFFGIGSLIDVFNFTIPVLGMEFSRLKPLPLLALAMAALVFAPGGAVRESIRLGRELLAYVTGEEGDGNSPPDESSSAIGEIVEKYRQELDEIIRDNGGDSN